jgi:hypothetical protein
LNIALAVASNTAVQMFLHKPVSGLMPRVPEGYVRMMMTAPGLYLCESLSRAIAGKDKVEAKLNRDKVKAQSVIRGKDEGVTFSAFSKTQPQGQRLSAQA